MIKMPSGLTLKLKATTFIQGKQQRVAALEENYELRRRPMILACAADAHARSEMVGPLSPDDDGVAYGASIPTTTPTATAAPVSGSPASTVRRRATSRRRRRGRSGCSSATGSRARRAAGCAAMRVRGAAERRRLARLPPKLKSGGGAASLYFPTEVRFYPPRRPLPARPARAAAHHTAPLSLLQRSVPRAPSPRLRSPPAPLTPPRALAAQEASIQEALSLALEVAEARGWRLPTGPPWYPTHELDMLIASHLPSLAAAAAADAAADAEAERRDAKRRAPPRAVGGAALARRH